MVLSAQGPNKIQHSGKCQRVGEIINYGEHLNAPGWFPGPAEEKTSRERHASLSHLFSHTPQHTHRDIYILFVLFVAAAANERGFLSTLRAAFLTSQSRRVLIISYHAPRRTALAAPALSLPTLKKIGTSRAPRVRKSLAHDALDVCSEGGVVLNFCGAENARSCRSWGI
jgi:hypothetical protein